MPDVTDIALAREFAASNSEPAFAELVRRHINLVYSVAWRYVGNAQDAQDVTQAVFIILAQKAAGLRGCTVLTGWLYETTRFTALRFLRTNTRRQFREQEAYMQSIPDESDTDNVWRQLAPLLEEAMTRLNEKERTLLALRFFENRTGAETAALLGMEEWAGRKRVNRALEKLRKFFTQRGVTLSTTAIAGAVSANSVHAAPVGLAKTISAVAIAKGAAAGGSTLALAKGALKIMAWTKAKVAVVVGVGVLLAAGTTTLTIKEIQKHSGSSWRLANFNPLPVVVPTVLGKTPPQVRILPSKYDHWVMGPFTQGDTATFADGKWVPMATNGSTSMGVGVTMDSIIRTAYGADALDVRSTAAIPKGRFDFIANLPVDAVLQLRNEIKKKFHLVGKWEMVETDVLALRIADPGRLAFQPANSLRPNVGHLDAATLASAGSDGKRTKDGSYVDTRFNESVNFLANELKANFQTPVVNETGLTNRYDFSFIWPARRTGDNQAWEQILSNELRDQLGLELVATNMPIKTLMVEKAK